MHTGVTLQADEELLIPPPVYSNHEHCSVYDQESHSSLDQNKYPSNTNNGSVNLPRYDDGDDSQQAFKIYKRRWYVLLVFSVAAATQTAMWNTWGSIVDTAKSVLGWTNADVATVTIWGGAIFVITVIPFTKMMDKRGLRVSLLTAWTFNFVGVAVRCIQVPPSYMIWTANAGQMLIAFSGPVLMTAPPLLSAVWFPPHQRTTATAISSTAAALGVAVSFVVGPLVVSEVKTLNSTKILNMSLTDNQDIDWKIKAGHVHQIYTLLVMEFAWVAVLFLLIIIYFPAKPPSPPCVTAGIKRIEFLQGAKLLVTSKTFWLLTLAYSVGNCILGVWVSQLDTILKNSVNVGQDIAGWVGFYTNIAGTLGGFIAGRSVDLLGGRMKLVLLVIYTATLITFLWFVLICYKIIDFNLASLYISCTLYGLLINSTGPIYYEITVEGMYPVAEGITIGALVLISTIKGLVFLFILMIPGIGVIWINWTALAMLTLTIPILLMYKDKYKRLETDKKTH